MFLLFAEIARVAHAAMLIHSPLTITGTPFAGGALTDVQSWNGETDSSGAGCIFSQPGKG